MPLAELPQNKNGKIDRNLLPTPTVKTGDIKKPKSKLEHQLLDIMKLVLNISYEIGVDQSFFALGGSSLLAINFVSRVRKEVFASYSITNFFATPTVEAVAAFIEEGKDCVVVVGVF